MASEGTLVACIGCGALVPDLPAFYGPAHRYLGASPGCWQMYTALTAKAMPDMSVRGLMADTYMVQHPGVPSRQSIQPVARHLVGLCCTLELDLSFERAVAVMRKAPVANFSWLEPPDSPWPLTVADIVQASGDENQSDLISDWAETTWQAWRIHHPVVRGWLEKAFP